MDTKLNWHKDADFTSQLKQYQGLTEQQLVAEKQKLEKKRECKLYLRWQWIF